MAKFKIGDIIYCKKDKTVFDYKGDSVKLYFGDKYVVTTIKDNHTHIWGGIFILEDKIKKIMYKTKRLKCDFGFISELRRIKLEKISNAI